MLKQFACATLALLASSAMGKGVSPYMPLNVSPEIEHHVEQVIALTGGAPLIKPYRASDILSRVAQIENSHPRLAGRLKRYLERFQQPYGMTHRSVELSQSNDTNSPLANQRNRRFDESYAISAAGIGYVNPYVMGSVGFTHSPDNNITHQGTYVSVGIDYAQLDFGYREHWYSPFEDYSMLVSTHAKASPSITLSNSKPITSWSLRYEIFYSKLEPVDAIVLGDETFPGSPRHGGVHISFNPTENWTIGLNRTLQFGGGAREVSFSDFVEAFFDPAGKDNVGDIVTDDINFEFGNQQASLTTRVNLDWWGMPFSVYGEYAGEDTQDESNWELGNTGVSLGIFFPFLTDDISLRIEGVDFANLWYVHHLYPDGYSNDGQFMGHWFASLRAPGDAPVGQSLSARSVWNIDDNQMLDVRLRHISLEDSPNQTYDTGSEIMVRYSYATRYGLFGIEGIHSQEPLGADANRVALFYRW